MGVYYSANNEKDFIHNRIIKRKIISTINTSKRKHCGLRNYSFKSNPNIVKVINISSEDKNILNPMYAPSESKSNVDSQISFNSSINSRECGSPTLPRRKSPTSIHAKIFNSCVPLSGLRRSLSLPKQNSLVNKHHSPEFRTGMSGSKCLSRHDSKRSATTGNASPMGTGLSRSPGSCSREPLLEWRYDKCCSQSPQDKQRYKEFDFGQDNLMFENCSNFGDDQTTNSTVLSSDYMHSTDDSSVFCDPLLAKLEAELPVPPPPPRACPPWLKAALEKQAASAKGTVQKLNVQDRNCAVSSLQLPTSQLSPTHSEMDKGKALSLENSRFNVRIYPIIQNGVKISDTHYWLLDPPRCKTLRNASTLMRRTTDYIRVPPSSPLDTSPTVDGYTNIESAEFCPPEELPLKDIKLRRGKSEICKDSLKHFHQELILRLMKQVPLATESECQAVLIGSSYDYDEASRRLKFELLCRKGYVSRSHSKRLLNKCNWDLDAAISRARYDYECRKLRCRQEEEILTNLDDMNSSINQTRSRSSFLVPRSTSSDSSLSPLPCPVHHQSIISPWCDESRKSNPF
ncbi:unnamed protein product [Heterobilharzia americana]|nr:unnamed protein product [Heterobilharzia americana]CAH8438046.1 unnamed protein product [Heterobilharzia americana]